MTSVDTSFLMDGLGQVLARGIANTINEAPADPVEYLALWLQHHLDEKEADTERKAKEEQLQTEREEWNRQQAGKEKSASEAIQREWKCHLKSVEERNDRESELRVHLEAFGEQLDEEGTYDPETVGYDNLVDQDAKDEEKEKELDMLKAEKLFQRWKAYINELSKGNIADLKVKQKVEPSVEKVIRCTFYLFGKLPGTKPNGEKIDATPSKLATWGQLKTNIKPHPFLEQLKTLDPVSIPKRRILRVERILSTTRDDEEVIRASGQAASIVSQLLWTAIEYRTARDDLMKAKKEGGKDFPGLDTWEDDLGEDIDGEEQDPDEEEQKEIERQLKQQQEAEEKEEEEPAE